ncbi:M16 family metallopeptidase [Mucilaginibacter lacusdianchii]|uniref:M16 family metallopeptidase n=1 Tax=Mucilaginibacter lacusdianchii TaxID=2684211 RepID=UPI001E46F0D2|nr:insulinase family protein [Mucilaginibacter sp. JXJ CY 39]
MKYSKIALFVFLAGLPALGNAQIMPKTASPGKSSSSQPLPLNPLVRTGKLPNGFTYYIQRNTEPKNRAYLYLANKVGSILETEEQQGLAHFMEHINFNGTTHFPKNELVNYLQTAGVRFGADLNAYTSFDETVYMLPIPSNKPDVLANGLQIMRDWAHGATLDVEEINKERGVILEEKRLGQGAAQRMRNQYMPVMFNGSRYASRLPIGQEKILQTFKPETIKAFFNDWYRPDLQALIIVGDVDVSAMEASVKKMFSTLKNPAKEKARTAYTVPLTGKNQFIVATDKEFPQTVVQVFFKHTGKTIKSNMDYRTQMVESLMNQMLAVRFSDLSKVSDPPFVNAGAGNSEFISNLEAFTGYVNAKPGQLEQGFKALWSELERARQYGFTAGELERAKTSYLKRVESQWREKDKTQSANFVDEYLKHFLHGEASPGIDAEYKLAQQYLPGITLTETSTLIQQLIEAQNRDIIIMAPEKDKATLPTEADVTGWISAVRQSGVTAYKEEATSAVLMAVKPVAGKVISEKKNDNLGITELTLSNGVKVILKPTTFNNNQISFTSFSPGGTSLVSDADYQSAANAASILASGGLSNLNAVQLPKVLNGKVAGAMPYISERTEGVSGSAAPADLETALQLTHLYFTKPRKDTAIFKGIISRVKSSLANRENDPGNVFNDTISAVLGSYNVRRTGPSIGKLNQIDLEKAYQIYKDRFADASDFTFLFVGSFDVGKIKPLLVQYLGSLPALGRREAARDLGIHTPEGRINKIVYKGTENKATVYMILSGRYDYNMENNLRLDALKEIIGFRMLDRLRESEGGVYTPGVRVNYSKSPQSRYAFFVNFGCSPANREKLLAAAMEEINRLKKDGPTVAALQKFIAQEKNSTETALKTNNFWLSYLNSQYQNGEDPNEILRYMERLNKLNQDVVKAAANLYLSDKNQIIFSLLPEERPGN